MPEIRRGIRFGGSLSKMNDSVDASILAPDTFAQLQNVDPWYADGLVKRSGRQRVSTSASIPAGLTPGAVTSLIPYDFMVGNTRYTGLVATDGRYFWRITPTGSVRLNDLSTTAVDMGAGASGTTWRGTSFGGKLYLQNGANKPLEMGVTGGGVYYLIPWGVEKPSAVQVALFTVAAANSTGRYATGSIVYVRLAFKNSTTGVTGNPSAVAAAGTDSIGTWKITVTAPNDDITITVPGLTTLGVQDGTDTVVVYVTMAQTEAATDPDLWKDGTIAIPAGVGTSTYTLSTSGLGSDDAYGPAELSIWTDLDNVRAERDAPPVCQSIATHNNRMWFVGGGSTVTPYTGLSKNTLLFSAEETPENVAYADQQTLHYDGINLPCAGDPLALVRVGDALMVMSPDEIMSVVGPTPQFYLMQLGPSRGPVGRKCVIAADGLAFYVAYDGIYAHSTRDSMPLTRNVLDTTFATFSKTLLSETTALYYSKKRQLWFFFDGLPTGSGVLTHVLVYQLPGEGRAAGSWAAWDGFYAGAVAVARTVHEATTTEYVYAIDPGNVLYVCDTGDSDGALDVGATMTASGRAGTIDTWTAGTSTLTDADGSFFNTGAKLAYCPVYLWSADRTTVLRGVVTSNTASTLVIAAAHSWGSSVPAAGWSYAVGGIGYRVKSAGLTQTGEGFFNIMGNSVHVHLKQNSYTGSNQLWAYLLLDGADAIASTDTKKQLPLGNTSTVKAWPSAGFGGDDKRTAGQVQLCLENYQEQAVYVRKAVFSFTVVPHSVGVP